MAKIFKQNQNYNADVKRNNFDLHHRRFGTYKLGTWTPVACFPTMNGDSFRINLATILNFFPTNFPTPTRMRVVFNWFYQPNRNGWKNWDNFIMENEEHVHPYISLPADSDLWRAGSLADHLGMPTTICTGEVTNVPFPLSTFNRVSRVSFSANGNGNLNENSTTNGQSIVGNSVGMNSSGNIGGRAMATVPQSYCCDPSTSRIGSKFTNMVSNAYDNQHTEAFAFSSYGVSHALFVDSQDVVLTLPFKLADPGNPPIMMVFASKNSNIYDSDWFAYVEGEGSRQIGTLFTEVTYKDTFMEELRQQQLEALSNGTYSHFFYGFIIQPKYTSSAADNLIFTHGSFSLPFDLRNVYDLADFPTLNPYRNPNSTQSDDVINVNALPFRMYEAIYQCYLRNQQGLQPFIIDGQEVFNRWNTTLEDGADTTDYHLFPANYELDAFTSSLFSPQQGNAPLVGLTHLDNLEVTDPNGIATTYTATADGDRFEVVRTSPNQSVENARTALQVLNAGFTIADFRAGSAFTRFKEINNRIGHRYDDFINAHFPSKPKSYELGMPEFLGGMTIEVNSNMITSTAETGVSERGSLGSFAGQLSALGRSRHEISKYADDFGYIMCVMAIIPDPSYSQVLPRHFTMRQPLDYPFPEFAHLSLQPLTYEVMSPIQSKLDSVTDISKKLTDTFGYQRPYYDMVHFLDTVHGQFRTTFKDYLVNRVFANRPELCRDFIEINQKDANNIFQYNDPDFSDDICFGVIEFDIKAKRPLPYVVL